MGHPEVCGWSKPLSPTTAGKELPGAKTKFTSAHALLNSIRTAAGESVLPKSPKQPKPSHLQPAHTQSATQTVSSITCTHSTCKNVRQNVGSVFERSHGHQRGFLTPRVDRHGWTTGPAPMLSRQSQALGLLCHVSAVLSAVLPGR